MNLPRLFVLAMLILPGCAANSLRHGQPFAGDWVSIALPKTQRVFLVSWDDGMRLDVTVNLADDKREPPLYVTYQVISPCWDNELAKLKSHVLDLASEQQESRIEEPDVCLQGVIDGKPIAVRFAAGPETCGKQMDFNGLVAAEVRGAGLGMAIVDYRCAEAKRRWYDDPRAVAYYTSAILRLVEAGGGGAVGDWQRLHALVCVDTSAAVVLNKRLSGQHPLHEQTALARKTWNEALDDWGLTLECNGPVVVVRYRIDSVEGVPPRRLTQASIERLLAARVSSRGK